ncbi:lipoyl(octanoyl) transferase [Antricoccus suffuscus]|uniref:Octanoyltransferase n=1 Tax=Antricoccus suffuscus TaxID=1629062 RepID=A0A2T0ZYC2_9ACTN|nr:lipoyl(octanoyl) transferase LipB [Antricoccus suffuscus]PRZ41333.1 lipoyl(octanoyl) transferase [Antricoccus suffuscus]
MTDADIRRLGRIDYTVAWELQQQLHDDHVNGLRGDTVLLLEHPSVYTAGKRTRPENRPSGDIPVIDVDRGGDITWHGEGQLVGYPIVRLADPIDVVKYVRTLEGILIEVCASVGVEATRVDGRSGVWIVGDGPDRKIAAIGVRVAHGVTMHGFALNCNPDMAAFGQIIPCGLADAEVTSLSQETGREVPIDEVIDRVEVALRESLTTSPVFAQPEVASQLRS